MRPTCKKCGAHAPTIDGNCHLHLSVATQGQLHCVSEEQINAATGFEKTTRRPPQ